MGRWSAAADRAADRPGVPSRAGWAAAEPARTRRAFLAGPGEVAAAGAAAHRRRSAAALALELGLVVTVAARRVSVQTPPIIAAVAAAVALFMYSLAPWGGFDLGG